MFAFFGIFLPRIFHFLSSKLHVFLTTYPPLSAHVFCESSLAIDIFQIIQDNLFFEKRVLNQICGFFQHFLALFETFSTLYNDPCIKFEFSG